jgi:hypothetical protein
VEVVGVDFLNVLYPAMLNDGLLDTSNYPPNHKLYSEAHKAQLGCIKDEFAGKAYDEFVLLRPKSYSMRCYQGAVKKRSKGVSRRKVKGFTHDDYKRVFQTEIEINANNRRMQSKLHVMYNIEQIKIALSLSDDKRAWVSNNLSYPYGFYNLREIISQLHDDVLSDDADDNTIESLYDDIM